MGSLLVNASVGGIGDKYSGLLEGKTRYLLRPHPIIVMQNLFWLKLNYFHTQYVTMHYLLAA